MKITEELKDEIGNEIFSELTYVDQDLVKLITNKVLEKIKNEYNIYTTPELIARFEIMKNTKWLNPIFMKIYNEAGELVQNGVTVEDVVNSVMLR